MQLQLRVLVIAVACGLLQGQGSVDKSGDSSTLAGGLFPGLLASLDLPPVPCLARNSCNQRDGSSLTYHDRNCFCDDLCSLYGDCCRDHQSQRGSNAPTSQLDPSTVSCTRVMEINPQVELYIVEKCPKDFPDSAIRQKCEINTDGVLTTGEAFYSLPVTSTLTGILYRNFHCAQCAGDTQVTFWNVRLGCGELPQELSSAPPKQVIRDVLQFTREGSHFCGVEFTNDQVSGRQCKTHISRCDRSYKNRKIRRKCRSHTSYVYVGKQVFKNKYCAVCNYVNESYLTCEDSRTPKSLDNFLPNLGVLDVTPPLAVILDLNNGKGIVKENRQGIAGLLESTEVPTDLPKCQTNHVYDPFADTCRQLLCHDNEELLNGRCLPTTRWSTTLLPPSTTVYTHSPSTQLPSNDPTKRPPTASEPIDPRKDYFNPDYYDRDVDDSKPVYGDEDVGDNKDGGDSYENHIEEAPDESCNKIMLNESDYWIFENLSLYVYRTQQWYSPMEYDSNGRVVTICNNLKEDPHTLLMFQYHRLQNFVSFVATLISIVAMSIQFIVYLIMAPLRTAAGKSLMCLSFSLITSQALLHFAVNQTQLFYLCFGFAIALHYFLLVAFMWTNVLAYDIWLTFTRRDTEKMEEGSCRFVCYSLYAWLVPAVVVGATVGLDFLEVIVEAKYRPFYGHGLCWMVHRYALLFTFALPIVLILAANIVLYIVTVRNIYIISQANKYEQPRERHRSRFVGYVLLSLIMGLTWVFAFLATLTNLNFLWYAFITLSCLTGVYILFVFVCNRKVLQLLKEKGRVHRTHNDRYYPYRGKYTRHTFLTEREAKVISQETSI